MALQRRTVHVCKHQVHAGAAETRDGFHAVRRGRGHDMQTRLHDGLPVLQARLAAAVQPSPSMNSADLRSEAFSGITTVPPLPAIAAAICASARAAGG